VYWPVRWRLLWAARRDRRAGLPVGLSAATTPLLRDLAARRDDACERERARYHADVRAIDLRLAEIDTELAALQLAAAEHTPDDDPQLVARRLLDDTLAEEAQLEARRQARADATRARALRLVEYADRLAAIYRRALLRRHPQREALLSRWDTTLPAPPEWVLTGDLAPAPGPAADG
jgi:hypothetical protein